MKRVIEYTLKDFTECKNKDTLIDLATVGDYDSEIGYRFTDDCYREMLKYMDRRIKNLEFEVLYYEGELIDNIEQEIIDEGDWQVVLY